MVTVKWVLSYFHLTNKIILCVKDEGSELRTLEATLTSIVSYKHLTLSQPKPRVSFEHIMSKACQYSTNDITLCVEIRKVSIKVFQINLQKLIAWTINAKLRRAPEEHDGIKHA